MRKDLVIENLPLVRKIAQIMKLKLPASYELDDLISYGTLGLIDAANKYDESKKVKFNTYASIRIKGSIIDEIRKDSWIPRSIVTKLKDLERVKTELNNKLLRNPSDKEIAKALNISLMNLKKIYSYEKSSHIISMDRPLIENDNNSGELKDLIQDLNIVSVHDVVENKDIRDFLDKTIKKLDTRERTIINKHYLEEITIKNIGKILNVSDSRVSQIHIRAIKKLNKIIRKEEKGMLKVGLLTIWKGFKHSSRLKCDARDGAFELWMKNKKYISDGWKELDYKSVQNIILRNMKLENISSTKFPAVDLEEFFKKLKEKDWLKEEIKEVEVKMANVRNVRGFIQEKNESILSKSNDKIRFELSFDDIEGIIELLEIDYQDLTLNQKKLYHRMSLFVLDKEAV